MQPSSPPSQIDPDPLIGTTLGSFRLVKRIGQGGMGSVYLGEQTLIGSRVAVKVLHEHLASDPSLVARFYAEARAVNLIAHPNIVNIFDMNVVPPRRFYLVMEYLEGEPLSAVVQGPMAAEAAIPLLIQVCHALSATHRHGVLHRDLKPENVFLCRREGPVPYVKILDFGISKLFGGDLQAAQTTAGFIVGTPEYMAPEQASGEPLDGRADLYALGIIAYRMATGRLPFSGGGVPGSWSRACRRPGRTPSCAASPSGRSTAFRPPTSSGSRSRPRSAAPDREARPHRERRWLPPSLLAGAHRPRERRPPRERPPAPLHRASPARWCCPARTRARSRCGTSPAVGSSSASTRRCQHPSPGSACRSRRRRVR
jgi:serine/threonine protein kinase